MDDDLTLPLVWPSSIRPQGGTAAPWLEVAGKDARLMGVVWALDSFGVQILRERLEQGSPGLKAKFVVAVHATSPTTSNVLRQLLELAGSHGDRMEAALIAVSLDSNASPMTSLCIVDAGIGRSRFWIGNSGNLGCLLAGDGHLNLAFEGDSTLTARWLDWFSGLWSRSAPLTPLTAEVPALVPARGTEAAAESWRQYEELCRQLGAPEQLTGGHSDGTVPYTTTQEEAEKQRQATEKICQDLGLPLPDPLLEKVARLFALGQVITIDKSSRTPPLELPIRAEWLGLEGSRTVGMISRETRFRIRIFDEQKSKALESKRNGVSELIKRLTYPLADGVRWIPLAARPLLERERARLEKDAQDLLRSLIGQSASEFAKSRRTQIEHDADQIYAELHPGGRLPQGTLNLILRDLEDRLAKATSQSFLPKVSYATQQFSAGAVSEHVAQWAPARTLLASVAEYGRKAVTEKGHLRGHEIPEDELLDAMNVCDDHIIRDRRDPKSRHVAKRELLDLEEILGDENDDRQKCRRILELIEGQSGPKSNTHADRPTLFAG